MIKISIYLDSAKKCVQKSKVERDVEIHKTFYAWPGLASWFEGITEWSFCVKKIKYYIS